MMMELFWKNRKISQKKNKTVINNPRNLKKRKIKVAMTKSKIISQQDQQYNKNRINQ